MERDIYDEDHEAFRDVVREFVKRNVTNAKREQWDADGEIDRATMLAAGEAGILGLSVPEEFGGAGMLQDYRFRAVVNEEVIAAGAGSLAGAFGIQDDLAVPYVVHMGTQEQKAKWLPRMATGEVLGALAMSEPGAGSDLRGIKTTAKKVEGGYLVNGAKTFISSGKTADIVVTFVKTGEGNKADAFSILIIENGMEGFDHGKKLHKMGFHGHDTAELSFSDVFVPEENLIGGVEGKGFIQLMMNLPLERLSIGVAAAAASQAAFDWTVAYTKDREAFGERIIDFQNSRFELADILTEVEVTEAYVDQAILAFNAGELDAAGAARAKLWASERAKSVTDRCLQLHGGYGYIMEYPVAQAYLAARLLTIFGGTNEIMRDVVGRTIAG